MSRFRAPYRAAPDRVRQSPKVLAIDWAKAVGEAAELAAITARDGEDPAFAERLVRWRAWLRDLASDNFPVPSEISRLVAASWLNLARAFAHDAGHLPSRTACAPLLAAVTAGVEDLLHAHRTAQADATWKRQFGDDD